MVVTAVTGSAASVNASTSKLGARTDAVALCDNTLNLSKQRAFEPAIGEREVTTVTVRQINGAACAGAILKVVLVDAAGAVLGNERTAIIAAADTQKILDFSADNTPDRLVANIRAVIVRP